MKRTSLIVKTHFVPAIMLFAFCFMHSKAAQAYLQQTSESTYECTLLTLDDIDPALLTKEERIALLDNSLSHSIDQFSSCVSSVQQAGASGQGKGSSDSGQEQGEGQSQQSEGAEQQQGSESGEGEQESSAIAKGESTSMSGTSIPQAGTTPNVSGSATPSQRGVIPPKDNDKIICKLLYDEITKTTNTDMLSGLKEQYANYKCG